MNEIEKISELVVPGLVTGLAVAVLSVRLALNRFYSEKWWERKYEAYTKIFDALFHMKNYAEGHYNAELAGRELPEQRNEELGSLARQAQDEINKAATVWAFILSQESTDCLRKVREQLNAASNERTFYEHLDSEMFALNKCIETLHGCAARDLKTSPLRREKKLFLLHRIPSRRERLAKRTTGLVDKAV